MNEIYNDLMKTINSLPPNPFAGKIVLIPAERITRDVEITEIDDDGKEVETTKTESYLFPLSRFRHIEAECRKLNIDYQLSEFVPEKDRDGKPRVFVMDKPSFETDLFTSKLI